MLERGVDNIKTPTHTVAFNEPQFYTIEALHVDDLRRQCTKPAIESRLSTQPRAMKVAYTGKALLHNRFVRFRLDTSGGQAVSLSAVYGWPKTPC